MSTQPTKIAALATAPARTNQPVRVEQREHTPADLDRGDDGERDDGLAVLAVHADRGGVDHAGADRRERGDGERRRDRERARCGSETDAVGSDGGHGSPSWRHPSAALVFAWYLQVPPQGSPPTGRRCRPPAG